MRAKFIYESIKDILKPKSKEEILFSISPSLTNFYNEAKKYFNSINIEIYYYDPPEAAIRIKHNGLIFNISSYHEKNDNVFIIYKYNDKHNAYGYLMEVTSFNEFFDYLKK
jgi:hypothetical protein